MISGLNDICSFVARFSLVTSVFLLFRGRIGWILVVLMEIVDEILTKRTTLSGL